MSAKIKAIKTAYDRQYTKLCVVCGVYLPNSKARFARCNACGTEIRARYADAITKGRHDRIASGQCCNCSSPSEVGRTRCRRCLEVLKRAQERYNAKRAATWVTH